MRTPHNVPGQANIYVLDVDSDVTGYGQHNRCTVGADPDGSSVSVFEAYSKLPWSTEAQRRKLLAGRDARWLMPRGCRLEYVGSVDYLLPSGRPAREHTYRVLRGARA